MSAHDRENANGCKDCFTEMLFHLLKKVFGKYLAKQSARNCETNSMLCALGTSEG